MKPLGYLLVARLCIKDRFARLHGKSCFDITPVVLGFGSLGTVVTVTAHLDAVTDRDVVFHPDGTNEKIWIIDMGRRMEPVVGQVYTNRGGGPTCSPRHTCRR